jgi:hypothetical protein
MEKINITQVARPPKEQINLMNFKASSEHKINGNKGWAFAA